MTPRIAVTAGIAMIALSAAANAQQSESRTMANECSTATKSNKTNRAHGEAWVQEKLKAFLPANDQSLRMTKLLEQAEQTALALTMINLTCEQFLTGKTDRETADRSLAGYEKTIDNFMHDVGNEISALSARGQVSDMGRIRQSLAQIGAAGRQAALVGLDEEAEKARATMIQSLTTWSTTFVESTCWDQAFSDELPFAVTRQHQILGTGIDVTPCAQRRFRAQLGSYTFESCSIHGIGEWRVRWNIPMGTEQGGGGALAQERDAATGKYSSSWAMMGAEYTASGPFALTRKNYGEGKKPTYTLSGELNVQLSKGNVVALSQLTGTKPGGKNDFKVDVQVSDKPCKSLN
jgi:hypothetical protein